MTGGFTATRSWALLALLVFAGAAHGQAPKATADMTTYASKTWHWSIAYPGNWAIDAADPDVVRIRSERDSALCSIVSGPVDRFNTVDELTDFMLEHDEQFLKEKGHRFKVLSRKRVALRNGVAANDILTEIGPGGRSRRINVLIDGRGLVVDCEANTKDWARLEPAYRRIIASFTVSK